MDKIEKALRKLTPKERERIKQVLVQLQIGNFTGLDIKKLKGREDIFRVRKGGFRIVYRIAQGEILVLFIERRRESTYNF